MRKTRKIAVGFLAAVLAVSMLTACGSGGTGGGGEGSNSKPPISEGDKKDDEKPVPTPGEGDGDKGEDTTDPVGTNSRTMKYLKRRNLLTCKKVTFQYLMVSNNQNNGIVHTTVSDSVRRYEKMDEPLLLNDDYELFDMANGFVYGVDLIKHTVIKLRGVQGIPDDATSAEIYEIRTIVQNYKPTSGIHTVNGVEYYSETYTFGKGFEMIFCFEKDDTEGMNLLYIESNIGNYNSLPYAKKILQFTDTVDYTLLQIPEGYRLYRCNVEAENEGVVDTGTYTPKDNYPN